MAEIKIEAVQLSLPSILDGKFFTVVNQTDQKVSVKCMLCPNKSLSARTDATSNLLKHLKVSLQVACYAWSH